MMGINVEESSLKRLVEVIGCTMGRWPIQYLGLPLRGNPKTVAFWDPVVEKVSKKLACWKRSYISIDGCITLIKATLLNILMYYMSLYKMPSKVTHATEKYQRDFL